MLTRATVVKVGGQEMEDVAWIGDLCALLATRARPLLIVHGGGREISALQLQMGAEPEWRDGLRVTTPAAIRAAAMVLSGSVNKRLVAALVDADVDAVGISGEDAALFRAEPAAGGALGRTGEIVRVQSRLLEVLVGSGFVPVISPVSRGSDGAALNVNADDAAAALAIAIGADELLFISNVPGVLRSGSSVPALTAEEAHALIADGGADGGMAPKLRAAARASETGVAVRIGNLDILRQDSAGTRVSAADSAAAA